MIKKLMLVFCCMFVSLQAQELNQNVNQEFNQDVNQEVFDLGYQEFVYDFGMLLVKHESIIDSKTAKVALIDLYNQIPQVQQLFDLIMIINEEFSESNVTTIQDFIDFQVAVHENIAQASIAWLAAYQNVFQIFVDIHGPDASFVDWYHDITYLYSLQSNDDLDNPEYEKLWQAAYDTMQAQKAFEDAWSDIE